MRSEEYRVYERETRGAKGITEVLDMLAFTHRVFDYPPDREEGEDEECAWVFVGEMGEKNEEKKIRNYVR
jgi:hypothetical protein